MFLRLKRWPMLPTIYAGGCYGERKQLPQTLSRRAQFSRPGKHSSLYQLRSTWRKTQEKSKMQFLISIPSCLQGYVSTSLCNELLAVSAIKGTLRKSWDFTKSPWQQQETSPKHASTRRGRRCNYLLE